MNGYALHMNASPYAWIQGHAHEGMNAVWCTWMQGHVHEFYTTDTVQLSHENNFVSIIFTIWEGDLFL